MRKILILMAVAAMACGEAQAQHTEFMKLLQENPLRAGANTDPYEFEPLHDTPAPKGYKPFYISHYGRHGSRSDWGGTEYAALVKALSDAKSAGILSAGGDSLLAGASAVLAAHDGMDGRLTPRGVREHRLLAERMYRRYRNVFTKGPGNVRAVSSMVPRCIVSMTAFTDRLTELAPSLEISWDTGEKFMAYISHDPSREIMQEARRLRSLPPAESSDTNRIMERIFKDPAAARTHVPSVRAFERQIFSTARVTGSFDLDADLFRFLPSEELCRRSEELNLYLYLGQCNSEELGDKRMPFSRELVQDVLSKADEAVEEGEYAADLRFGHDYQLLALAAYLGLEGVGERMTAHEARMRWYGFRYTPFAANLQFIFYRNKAGEVLVKFLLNERETRIIDLSPLTGPYYRWTDVKAHLDARLRRW